MYIVLHDSEQIEVLSELEVMFGIAIITPIFLSQDSQPILVLQKWIQTFSEAGRSSTKKSALSFVVMATANPETFSPTKSAL